MEKIDRLESYKIDLHGLNEGVNTFLFKLDDGYFEEIESEDVRHGLLNVTMQIDRKGNVFEVAYQVQGNVTVSCDICLDDMEQPIEAESRLVAKFGKEYSEDDDLVTIDEDEGVLDVSWFIYETIVLNIPIKHVHAPGKCNREMMKALEAHSATRSGVEEEEIVDPRWSELLKIKENKEF